MHPQTAKNRSKKNLKKQVQSLRDRMAELSGEMLLLQTLLGLGDQFEKKDDRLIVRIPVPPGWYPAPFGIETSNREVSIELKKKGDMV